tara:strand:+ start:1648 stop:2997 length:1350 start_codon:yes stop_codon:yes gene_type:complete
VENNSKTISKLPFPLRDYQSAGVNFLVTRKNILLADEMGLGKTIQTIVSIRILFQEKEINNCLIVVPVSLISNWVFEFGIWGGVIKPKIIQGNQKKRLTLYSMQSPVQIVSYESIRNDLELIADSKFYDLVVIDEAQRIKNDTSATSKIIKKIPRKYSWALTGTPLENNIEDIASIFGFVKPKTISKYDFPREIKEKIDQFTIRRRKREVLKELPDVIEQTVRISLTPTQWTTYENTRSEQYKYIKQLDKKEKISGILALITELKKITNFDSYSEESSKADYISDILEEKKMLNEKVIIFSQYVETLKFLERKFHSYKTQMYTGGQSQSERDEIISSYKQSEEFELLLISLKAGGVGLNLQETDTLILFDRWWNPAVEEQAIGRADRFGREGSLHVIKFVTHNTIEERIERLLFDKKDLFNKIVEEVTPKTNKFSEEDLMFIIGGEKNG